MARGYFLGKGIVCGVFLAIVPTGVFLAIVLTPAPPLSGIFIVG